MYRYAINDLLAWKSSPFRKPLILEGARQVGKTWLLKEFGKTAYKDTVYVNFDGNKIMAQLFANGYEIKDIIQGLELYAKKKITPEETLIIFDEIQEVPQALTSLKYFCENAPEYHVVSAGSLLGIALHQGTSFPVGKVDFLTLRPLNFKEYLLAINEENIVSLMENGNLNMLKAFKDKIIGFLKQYYYIGGMPEVVLNFTKTNDFKIVRATQKRILNAYEQDYSKHAPNEIVTKIRMLWNSIPSQLAKENRKFIYGIIKEGARAKDYEIALTWLYDCGLVHQVKRISTPNIPLKAYEDLKAFKLYMLDVGLLGAMSGLSAVTVIEGSKIFKEFKGALTEQFVLQELVALDVVPYYYTNDRNSAEIDFLIEKDNKVIPIEVKAERNLLSKSLKTYREKYNPEISIRLSMEDYKQEPWLINLPLYLVSEINKQL